MPSGMPVEMGVGPAVSPSGGERIVRTNVPDASYSLMVPVITDDTYRWPSGPKDRPEGVTMPCSPGAMNRSFFTDDAIGAPVPSVESHPPAASADVGNGPW